MFCEQDAIADPLLRTENKHKNISRDSYTAKSETSRINIREQMSVHVESIRRETNKDLK